MTDLVNWLTDWSDCQIGDWLIWLEWLWLTSWFDWLSGGLNGWWLTDFRLMTDWLICSDCCAPKQTNTLLLVGNIGYGWLWWVCKQMLRDCHIYRDICPSHFCLCKTLKCKKSFHNQNDMFGWISERNTPEANYVDFAKIMFTQLPRQKQTRNH